MSAARGLGVPDTDPALAAVLAGRPHWKTARVPPKMSPEAVARAREHASRVEAVLSAADLSRFPALGAEARRAAAARDLDAIDRLLRDPSFIAGGAEAGAALAGAGESIRSRAQSMAKGADPVLRDVGLGALNALDLARPAAR